MGTGASAGVKGAIAASSDADLKTLLEGLDDSTRQKLKTAVSESSPETSGSPDVVFVLGGPGAGKGTFADRIVQQFGYKTLSAGDLIRAERARPGSEKAELIESRIKDGKLIPSEITVGLIEDEMKRQGWDGKYLIDGFPRSVENFETFHTILGSKVNLKFTFLIECSESVMEERLLNRGKTSGRSDDNIETIKKRFVTFKEETLPVLEVLGSKFETKKINSDPGIDNVWNEVEAIFGA